MLEAGIALFADLPLPDLLAGLNVSNVARRARVTRPTFYAHWRSQDEYVAELVAYALDPARNGGPDAIVAGLAGLAGRNDDLLGALQTLLDVSFESRSGDRDFRLELALWGKVGDPRVRTELSALYRSVDDAVVRGSRPALERWRREPRPPLTLEQVVAALDAVLVGLVMRNWIDPDLRTAEVYRHTVAVLLLGLTRSIDDPDDLTTFSRRIDDFPRAAAAPAEPPAGSGPDAGVLDRDAVIDVTRQLMADRPWFELTLTEIAGAADTTEDAVTAAFGSRAGLGCEVLSAVLLERLPPPSHSTDPVTSWSHLADAVAVVVGVLSNHLALTLGAIGVGVRYVGGNSIFEIGHPVVEVIAHHVRAAERAGALDASQPAVAVAALLVRTAVAEVAMGTGPGGIEVMLRGLRADRVDP